MHVTLKGINLRYLAQMKSHLRYYTQFGTGHFKNNLGKRQPRGDEKNSKRFRKHKSRPFRFFCELFSQEETFCKALWFCKL